jgi:Flp pilus assembly pilin Flp
MFSIQAARDDLPAVPAHLRRRDPGPEPTQHTMDRTMIERLSAWPGLKVDRRGVVALEYAQIVGLLAVIVLTASTELGASIEAALTNVAHLL